MSRESVTCVAAMPWLFSSWESSSWVEIPLLRINFRIWP